MTLLQNFVRDFPQAVDLTHVNILAELQMDAGNFAAAAATIAAAGDQLCHDTALPIDLQASHRVL